MPLPKLLVIELWGIGDLTLATGFLRAAVEKFEVTLLGKPHARTLLGPAFPQIRFLEWDAPWTAFTGKYRIGEWDWPGLSQLVSRLRREKFAAAVSIRRRDARDHLLLFLAQAKRRLGFPHPRGRWLLTDQLGPAPGSRSIALDWQAAGRALGLEVGEPALPAACYHDAESLAWTARRSRPLICLHTGARIATRRWPEQYFSGLIGRLRDRFEFDLLLIPDPDGYGLGLAPLADRVIERLSLPQLVGVLGEVDLVLCNDSAPGHLAAATGTPVCTIFGPTDPLRYAPRGENVQVVIRDICPFRPCFDYCRFPEPRCLTLLPPTEIWPEVENFVAEILRVPSREQVPADFVVAVIATHRRAPELSRCLAALAAAGPELRAVVVADNADDEATGRVVAEAGALATRVVAPHNLGAGGGLALALKTCASKFGSQVTHYCILDDDTVVPPGGITALLRAMKTASASVACPIIVGSDGGIGWFPKLLDGVAWSTIKSARTVEDYRAVCGDAVQEFTWSTFVCLLATAEAVNATGRPREDFWVRGEDLEYSLRLTAGHHGIFVPAVEVRHLQPADSDPHSPIERWKILAMLQNSAFLWSREPHARSLARHFPGNVWRFLCSESGGLGTLPQVFRAIWNGFVRGRPAGVAGADQFRQRALGQRIDAGRQASS